MLRNLFLAVLIGGLATPAIADGDISKVNGAIRIEAGQSARDLSTVNGSIRVGENARIVDASTVNGSIEIEAGASLRSAETVNGRITLGARVQVAQGVETVNGSISLRDGAVVSGKASTVNGSIRLEAARVGGGIETVSGDIDVGAGSHVEGGILVERISGWSFSTPRAPRIVIGPRAVVEGTLEFRREVELLVSESARIGEVKGATAVRFGGDKP